MYEVGGATLIEIERRVLWLATRMIDAANRERHAGTASGGSGRRVQVKVGGHQASSASMVGIMTALWFGHLDGDDKVAVKPHASPVFHAIKYLTGELDRSYLTRLRDARRAAGLPAPDEGPRRRRLLDRLRRARRRRSAVRRRGAPLRRRPLRRRADRPARFIALVGDAELDEGNVWEAIADPALQGLGNVMWVVDINRQSLDRVIPDMKIKKLMEFFDGAGWHVVEAKYGRAAAGGVRPARRRRAAAPHRRHVERGVPVAVRLPRRRAARARSCAGADDDGAAVRSTTCPTTSWRRSCRTSAATTSACCSTRYRACDAVTDRPSVVFAYTVKGWGLPIAGDPLNHAALLSRGSRSTRCARRARARRPTTSGTASPPDVGRGAAVRATSAAS